MLTPHLTAVNPCRLAHAGSYQDHGKEAQGAHHQPELSRWDCWQPWPDKLCSSQGTFGLMIVPCLLAQRLPCMGLASRYSLACCWSPCRPT